MKTIFDIVIILSNVIRKIIIIVCRRNNIITTWFTSLQAKYNLWCICSKSPLKGETRFITRLIIAYSESNIGMAHRAQMIKKLFNEGFLIKYNVVNKEMLKPM